MSRIGRSEAEAMASALNATTEYEWRAKGDRVVTSYDDDQGTRRSVELLYDWQYTQLQIDSLDQRLHDLIAVLMGREQSRRADPAA